MKSILLKRNVDILTEEGFNYVKKAMIKNE